MEQSTFFGHWPGHHDDGRLHTAWFPFPRRPPLRSRPSNRRPLELAGTRPRGPKTLRPSTALICASPDSLPMFALPALLVLDR
ncbi:hypothetical protein CTRI78_v001323 [Colletotrichum trifolii]|uniref:Uncharacterized protein n=1 Tax=Colletotrichum trifolii TaxID=5466 RepID=A0A4R8RT88_COLTR|nr:hypothetical protein CTRI78_v001323 [Colletotrichum trifolii]